MIADEIRRDHPDWSSEGFICADDLARYRTRYVERLLERERGELSALERRVLDSLAGREIVARNVDAEFDRSLTFGERLADRIADFGGSWTFILSFTCFLVLWMMANTVLVLFGVFDPYPFILLNLVLSCLAAVQAPIIMMSQNRQEEKDRRRAEQDYAVNLKAELEIRHLHEKVDHLLSRQWERLIEVQELQLELLEEISEATRARSQDRDGGAG